MNQERAAKAAAVEERAAKAAAKAAAEAAEKAAPKPAAAAKAAPMKRKRVPCEHGRQSSLCKDCGGSGFSVSGVLTKNAREHRKSLASLAQR